jgi:CO/xanthine dehydrogenase Mo-binding subunit
MNPVAEAPGGVAAPPRGKVRDEVVGKSVARVDGHAKVTGATKYSTDFYLRGMLHAKILFSDRPRARIVSIDTSRAEALPGVKAVVTGADVPDHRYGLYIHDRTILAKGEVRYVGDHVAAVAATSELIAAEAVALVDVVYKDLPALFDTDAALAEDAPPLHPHLDDYSAAHPYLRGGNVGMHTDLERGDVSAAMAAADVVVEGTYRTAAINHGAIEPHGCVAGFDHRGRLTVWTATQQLSVCHSQLAMALGMPMTQVRVTPLGIGGGFGGKLHTNLEPLTAVLAQKTGQSVRLVMTREEEFFTAKARPPYTIRVTTGATKDGKLLAADFDIVADMGAYSDNAVGTASHALSSADGPYHFPAIKAEVRAVYTNNPDYGCMRGYGTYQLIFALEAHMDVLAKKLDMDPAELRMKNVISNGDPLLTNQPVHGVRIRETMEKALERSGYWDKKGSLGPNRGIGIANVVKTNGLLASSASTRLNEDGTVSITTAAVEIGTGTHTILAQIASEVLDMPMDRISVAAPDSDTAAFDLGSIASRTVFDNGSAVRLAAEELRDRIAARAAEVLVCDPSEIIVGDEKAYRESDVEASLDLGAVAGISAYSFGGPLIGVGTWNASKPHDPPLGRGFTEGVYPSFAYGTHVVEVEVDPDTGQTRVLNYTACHDIGRAINPMAAEGQIEGGITQALGSGLWEEMIVKEGVIVNPNFVDYRMPTMLDTPPIDVSLIEEPDRLGPFGAKGIGEHPILGPGPALVNAIADATGAQLSEIPVTPERLYDQMQAGT